MHLLYCSSATYPSPYANRVQILAMAKAFDIVLKKQFTLGGRNIVLTNNEDNLHIINFPGTLRSFFLSLKYLFFLKKHPEITVVYGREEKLLLCFMWYNKIFFRLPLKFVYEAHGMPHMSSWMYKAFIRQLDKITALTTPLKEEISHQTGRALEDILVTPDGVDLKYFDLSLSQAQAREQLDLPLDKNIVLYTGSFFRFPWKGVDVLLEASTSFGDESLFLLVGGTREEIDTIREKYPQKNICLVQQVDHKKVALYLRAANIVVLPNKSGDVTSERYTSPMKLFEYMASQVPIIASDLPSLRDILHEQNSILVPPSDTQSLVLAIQKLLASTELSHRLAATAYQEVHQYTWEKRAANIIQFISH